LICQCLINTQFVDHPSLGAETILPDPIFRTTIRVESLAWLMSRNVVLDAGRLPETINGISHFTLKSCQAYTFVENVGLDAATERFDMEAMSIPIERIPFVIPPEENTHDSCLVMALDLGAVLAERSSSLSFHGDLKDDDDQDFEKANSPGNYHESNKRSLCLNHSANFKSAKSRVECVNVNFFMSTNAPEVAWALAATWNNVIEDFIDVITAAINIQQHRSHSVLSEVITHMVANQPGRDSLSGNSGGDYSVLLRQYLAWTFARQGLPLDDAFALQSFADFGRTFSRDMFLQVVTAASSKSKPFSLLIRKMAHNLPSVQKQRLLRKLNLTFRDIVRIISFWCAVFTFMLWLFGGFRRLN
jgi:hypothetical protein